MSLSVPVEVLDMQSRAADPGTSAWVSANAGSGKTHVLAQRVIRLLLGGTEPARILCLTYTRAAAANMSNRVFQSLGSWSMMPDEELAERVREVTGRAPDAPMLARARRLFASALETPGGLKIQTIHAFCEAVLHQFPIEANIAGHFELLDDQMGAALLAEARRDLIGGASGGKGMALEKAFAHILSIAREFGFEQLLQDVVEARDRLRAFIDGASDGGSYAPLFTAFGFAPGETARSVAEAAWPVPGFSKAEFDRLVSAAEQTSAALVLKHIVPKAAAAFGNDDPLIRLRLMADGFLTDKREPYGETTFKKGLREALPGIMERYEAAAQHLIEALDRSSLLAMLEATRSAMTIADWLIARYERLKSARGFLDFNDLIQRTVNLLSRPDAGLWVQYKLDQGIDHVLIDEGQDTSPQQWEVVRRLTEEFFSGEGARAVERTVFAVGDEKQSIYSFQGADPEAFATVGHHFRQAAPAAGARFEQVELSWSFRSVQDVLLAVDRVFSSDVMREGVTTDLRTIRHRAVRANQFGHVEVWPVFTPQAVEEPDDWRQPIDHASAPAVQLANKVAATIAGWMNGGDMVKGRPIRPGDVLVLVRKRDRFVNALTRALKNLHVRVAGADRLRLTDHIAVKDLVALGRFVQQDEDDLSLAALLRSPVFGLSDDELFTISYRRDQLTLFAALRERAGLIGRDDIVVRLEALRNAAAFQRPYEFFAHFLSGERNNPGARSRFVARLGPESGEILDEFLSFCLAAERSGIFGMEGLLALLEGSAPEISRQMDQDRDEVRIMTVHAAKGLEAPIVFLVDPGSDAAIRQHLPRLIPFSAPDNAWQGPGYLWRGPADIANSRSKALDTAAMAKAAQEYRRLLYVGMTRAEDRLIVCGYQGQRGPSAATWRSMVETALEDADGAERLPFDDQELTFLRFTVRPPGHAPAQHPEPQDKAAVAERHPAMPGALLAPPPAAPPRLRPLAPSGVSLVVEPDDGAGPVGPSPVLSGAGAPAVALRRGIAVHRLLQSLPALDPDQRRAAAHRYLARAADGWPQGEMERTVTDVMAVLEDEAYAGVFAPGSRAEVEIMGTLQVGGSERAVAGKIDRLRIDADAVHIVDYKANRPAPATLAEVAPGHVAQLALYGALLAQVYPGRRIAAGLLFTDAPRLIEVPQPAMQAALERLGVR